IARCCHRTRSRNYLLPARPPGRLFAELQRRRAIRIVVEYLDRSGLFGEPGPKTVAGLSESSRRPAPVAVFEPRDTAQPDGPQSVLRRYPCCEWRDALGSYSPAVAAARAVSAIYASQPGHQHTGRRFELQRPGGEIHKAVLERTEPHCKLSVVEGD